MIDIDTFQVHVGAGRQTASEVEGGAEVGYWIHFGKLNNLIIYLIQLIKMIWVKRAGVSSVNGNT